MAYEDELFNRIARLERKLENYHDRLEIALEHDREFQLEATWKIVNTLVGCGAVFLLGWAIKLLGIEGWLAGGVFGVGMIFAYLIGYAWSDTGRKKHEKKLAQLPAWDPSSPS